MHEPCGSIYPHEAIRINSLTRLEASRFHFSIEVRCDETDSLDCSPTMCHTHDLYNVEIVLCRPLPPVPLNDCPRINEDAVEIEYHGVAPQLLHISLCDFSTPSLLCRA